MAKEKLVKNITSRDEDFAQWYTDVVREANLCDYSSVKGCMNYLPNGYAIWELIQADLDRRFKETGVENVYLPVLIPESLLEKEADHVEGFAPECAVVTKGGLNELEENLILASRNLGNIALLEPTELNVLDLSYADVVLTTKEALEQIEEVLR